VTRILFEAHDIEVDAVNNELLDRDVYVILQAAPCRRLLEDAIEAASPKRARSRDRM
jgi:hypothetical protein